MNAAGATRTGGSWTAGLELRGLVGFHHSTSATRTPTSGTITAGYRCASRARLPVNDGFPALRATSGARVYREIARPVAKKPLINVR
jgi:hypothetical protein